MGKGPDYLAKGVEVLGADSNWVRVGWGESQVLIAERKSEDQMLIVKLGDDIEETIDEVVAQVLDRGGDVGRACDRIERFLTEVDADEILLIDPGRNSKCDPVLLTRERRRLVVWQRVEDRRSRSGWRWDRSKSYYDEQVPTVFFDGESGEVSVTKNTRQIA